MSRITARENAYVRVPHGLTQDPRFEGVFGDDHRLAWWLRMLLQADTCWPALAPLPRVPRKIADALANAGLIELLPLGTFRVPGMDADRSKRVAAGRTGGLASAQSTNSPTHRPDGSSDGSSDGSLDDRSTYGDGDGDGDGALRGTIPAAPLPTTSTAPQPGSIHAPFGDVIELRNKPGGFLEASAPSRPARSPRRQP